MTLEPTKNLCSSQNKTDIAKIIDRLQNEGQHSYNKIISRLFSGDQNFSKNFPLHAKVTLVKHIESNMLEENDDTRLNLETDIEHVKTLLKEKKSDGFDDDIVAYLCRKYLKEANSDYQDKKYEDALNKYKLVLECLPRMKKDEKLLEDTQNIIASCYCGLGIQKKPWEEKIKNYDYGLKYASNKFLQNILTENKTIVVNNALKEAKSLIDRLNYNGALDICKKILVMPPISELIDDTVKIETRKLLLTAFTGEGKKALQQANRAPKVDKYNKVINLFKEALSVTNEDYEVRQINEDIALALTGILRTQFNKQEYYEAIETCKEGLKYTTNSEMIKKFKTQCIKIFKKIIEHQHKEEIYSKAIEICEESLKYTEHPEIIDTFQTGCILIFQKWKEYVNKIGSLEQYLKYEQNLEKAKDLPNLLSDKLEIYDKIYEHLLEEGKHKEAMEYISKIYKFFKDLSIDRSTILDTQQLLSKMQIHKIALHFHCYNTLTTIKEGDDTLIISEEAYKEASKHMQDALDDLEILVKKEDISTKTKQAFEISSSKARNNIIQLKAVYLNCLLEKEEYELSLEIVQEILFYDTGNQTEAMIEENLNKIVDDAAGQDRTINVNSKVFELIMIQNATEVAMDKFLEKFSKTIENYPIELIADLNINPCTAKYPQVKIMRAIAKSLYKFRRFEKAIEKYDQISKSQIPDELKEQIAKEKSNASIGLIHQAKESENLLTIIAAYKKAIPLITDSALKTFLDKDYHKAMKEFNANASKISNDSIDENSLRALEELTNGATISGEIKETATEILDKS